MKKYFKIKNYKNYLSRKVRIYFLLIKNKKINNLIFLDKKLKKIKNVEDLINFHFKTYSEKNHINREMFRIILNHFGGASLNILETGSAAHGTKSSMLFANYVKKFGGNFDTVDTNPQIKKIYSFLESNSVKFHTQDSLEFIKSLDDKTIHNLDLIYLDSYDLDIFNPEPSQNHGLNEFLLLNEKIKKGTLIAIDDTPDSFDKFSTTKENKFNFIPGKGRFVLNYLKENSELYEIIYHEYSVVIKKL